MNDHPGIAVGDRVLITSGVAMGHIGTVKRMTASHYREGVNCLVTLDEPVDRGGSAVDLWWIYMDRINVIGRGEVLPMENPNTVFLAKKAKRR